MANGWNFVLDGQTIWSFNNFKVERSRDPACLAAEEVTNSPSASGSLGPVEFRNLSYLDQNYFWNQVTSLTAISGCGGLNPNCGIIIPYGVTVLGPNNIVAGTGEQRRINGAMLWPQTFMLTVDVPVGVQVTVDGTPYYLVEALSLFQGTHSISVPQFAQRDSMHRFRFEGWSDGSTDLSRHIDLSSDTTLQAVYVQQYKLTIISSYAVSGDGWYDQGSVASFSASLSIWRLTITSLQVFSGWYDNGVLVSNSVSGSVLMDRPYTLEPVWNSYPLLPAILIVLSVVGLAYFYRVHSRAGSEEDIAGQGQDSSPIAITRSAGRPACTVGRLCSVGLFGQSVTTLVTRMFFLL